MKYLEIGSFAAKTQNLKPANFPDEMFDLLSIPAYDRGQPEIVRGSDIGSSKQIVAPGDVMISKIVPHIRRVWIVPESEGRTQIASGEWIVFRNSDFYGPWLRQLLLSESFHQRYMQTVAGVGGSLLRARPTHVFRIRIRIPDLGEQVRIAGILDKSEALRAKRREVLSHLDTLGQSIFHKMFAGLSGDSLTLRNASLRFVSGRNMVGTGANAHPTRKVLKVNAASSGEFDGSQVKPLPLDYEPPSEHRVEAGDLIVTRASGTKSLIGVATLIDSVPSETYLPDKLWKAVVDPELLLSEYFRFLTRSTAYRKYVSNAASGAAGVSNISQAKLLDFRLVLPPIELQKAFADRIAATERLKTTYRAQLAELDNLFLSLQDRAFKGEM